MWRGETDEKKIQNKYRIESTRLQNHDYGTNGIYFITICTKNRTDYFGEIEPVETQNVASPPSPQMMMLSEIGKIANQCWLEIPNHFPFVKLDEFVIMPNHIHGLIVIDKSLDANDIANANVETQNFASLRIREHPQNKFGPQSQNLASVVRGFKIGVTKYARKNNINFAWQSRFYDHVVRNDDEYQRIKYYIISNPLRWKNDRYKDSTNKHSA